MYDSKQKHQELHTSERTIVPRTVIFVPGTVLSVRVHADLLGNSYPEDPHSGKRDLKAAQVQGNRHLTLEGTIVQ